MLFSRSISRFAFPLLGVAIAAIAACSPAKQSPNVSSSSGSVTEPIAAETLPVRVASAPSKNTKAQFSDILGTQQEGWLPKMLAGKGLKNGLTPAATGKILPGAEQVSEFGFSKVPVSNIPGLKQYEFYYANDDSGKPTRLTAVKLQFDPAMNQSYTDLVSALSDKYGAPKPEEVEKQIIVWVGPEFVTAQLTKSPIAMSGYELNVSLEKD